MREDQKNSVVVLLVIVLVVGAVLLYRHVQADKPITTPPTTQNPEAPATPTSAPVSDKDTNGCYTPDNIRSHYGETACVDYNVGYTHETSAGTKFIDQLANYTAGFVGYVPYNSNAEGINLSQLDGKNIKVTGLIQEYSGYPEIVINELSQVGIYKN